MPVLHHHSRHARHRRGMAKWLADNQTVILIVPDQRLDDDLQPLRVRPPDGVWVAIALAAATSLLLRRRSSAATCSRSARTSGGPPLRRPHGLGQGPRLRARRASSACRGSSSSRGSGSATRPWPSALELDIIAAVIIGGASLNGGSGTILGSIIGALIMSVPAQRVAANGAGLTTSRKSSSAS